MQIHQFGAPYPWFSSFRVENSAKRCLTLCCLRERHRGMVERRSFIRNLQKILLRFKKKSSKIRRNSCRKKYLKKISDLKNPKFPGKLEIFIMQIINIFEFPGFSNSKMLIIYIIRFRGLEKNSGNISIALHKSIFHFSLDQYFLIR